MITPLRRKFIDDMRLLGFAPSTQKVYVQAVQVLAKYYHLSPEFLCDEQIRQFFLHQIDTGVSEGTFRTRRFALQTLFTVTLNRPMPCLDKIKPRQIRKIPQILSVEEVFAINNKVRSLPAKACLWTTYCCGLRRSEAINLQVRDIDSARNVVLVRQGKGARDRQVPMSPQLLEMLRQYWVKERPQVWLFPNRKGDAPIPAKTLDRIFRLALIESGVKKQASLHTLRHSYATHLLESGVNLRIIQEVLGHSSPRTTAIYTHVTQKSCQQLLQALAEMAIPSLKIN